jgi:hypothetical protein
LSPLLKARVSWIVARQDRAWYALGEARRRLRALGQSDEQIYRLDGDWAEYTPAECALFRVARQLAAAPIVLTDDEVAEALKEAGPRAVVQLINYTTGRAFFDRVTEAAGLPLEECDCGRGAREVHAPVPAGSYARPGARAFPRGKFVSGPSGCGRNGFGCRCGLPAGEVAKTVGRPKPFRTQRLRRGCDRLCHFARETRTFYPLVTGHDRRAPRQSHRENDLFPRKFQQEIIQGSSLPHPSHTPGAAWQAPTTPGRTARTGERGWRGRRTAFFLVGGPAGPVQ